METDGLIDLGKVDLVTYSAFEAWKFDAEAFIPVTAQVLRWDSKEADELAIWEDEDGNELQEPSYPAEWIGVLYDHLYCLARVDDLYTQVEPIAALSTGYGATYPAGGVTSQPPPEFSGWYEGDEIFLNRHIFAWRG